MEFGIQIYSFLVLKICFLAKIALIFFCYKKTKEKLCMQTLMLLLKLKSKTRKEKIGVCVCVSGIVAAI